VAYGATVRGAALEAARNEAERCTSLGAGALLADIDKSRVLPFVLTALPDVTTASAGSSLTAGSDLCRTCPADKASVLYATDANGTARAAST
jgi:C4-dicarboxylate-specific signal transduction histidine kinase